MRKLALISLLSISFIAGTNCSGITDAADHILFGISVRDGAESVSPAESCASEITVTTTQMDMVEDGDVTRSYSTTDPYYTDVDADGGTKWGFRQVETCVYLNDAFTGTVEIPVSSNGTYAGRLDVKTSFPAAADPQVSSFHVSPTWPGATQNLPSTLRFVGNGIVGHGTASRQCFTVARINDGAQNASESARVITLGKITSGDDGNLYTSKNPCDISVTLEDDETPGVRVSNISNIMEEPGGGSGLTSGTFSVRLRTAPTQNVTVPINELYDSKNAGHREGTVNKTSLVFTPGNFNVDQLVTVTSVDDLQIDGTVQYTIQMQNATSADTTYNGLKPRDVVIINQDQSIPGYVYTLFDATGGQTNKATGATVNGFATDQMNNMGSTYSKFQLRLRSKPSANVQLNFATSDATVSNLITTTLTFTPSDWNTAQWVFVEGKPNGSDGANTDFTISFTVTSADTNYNNAGTVARPTFVMRSCDNDFNRVIQPCNFSGSPFGTAGSRLSGAEPSATTAIWLITKASPGSAVTVGLTSGDTTEGTVPASVSIDSSNYNTLTTGGANRVVLTHVDDILLDNSVNWTVTTGTSSGGLAYDPIDIFATTTDDEQRYTITKTGNTHENETTTAEVKIYLAADNATQVTMTVGCSLLADECKSVSPTSITWNANESGSGFEKTITVTGKDDTFADGNQNFNVTFTVDAGSDGVFLGNNPSSQSITNVDDEQPGKAIFVTANAYQGEMSGIGGGADVLCGNAGEKPAGLPSGTYKALMIRDDATDRRMATTTGTDSTGQTGWVLTANYNYYLCTGSGAANCSDEFKHMFQANSAALIPFPMDRDFSASTVWTGMNGNMTAATQSNTPAKVLSDPDYRDNCAGWTYKNAPESPSPLYYGQSWSAGTTGNIISNTNVGCNTTLRIICVQQ
ncbi:MAG: DUF1554 domain-containing protein [Spirochaetia bacterium]|nr:DUF1554 domain-containing protein [Spirochaetia bacterium]